MDHVRELTSQDKALIQAVTEWNMLAVWPMYSQINARIDGKIRITAHNRKRLSQLVKEGYLGLQGKRYFNPSLKEPEKNHPNEVVASTEEMLQHAQTHALIFFILSLRTHEPNELPTIVKWFHEEGLTQPRLRKLELIVALLSMLMKDYKSIPEIPVNERGDMVGTDIIDDVYKLIHVSK